MPVYFKKSNVTVKVNDYIKSKKKIGLVPTMGSLHEGHISLIKKAKQNNDVVWVSIFVNPTQFNSSKDLINYPKDLNKDIKLIKEISKDINVFSPEEGEMYSGNPKIKVYDFENLDNELEGKFRKNHFNGVATIVSKLLSLFKPNNIYFGEKDMQQFKIIQSFIQKNYKNIQVIGCKTIREKSGIAYSSRNFLLSKKDKDIASKVYHLINCNKEKILKRRISITIIENIFYSIGVDKIDYIKVVNLSKTTKPFKRKSIYKIFIAYYLKSVRLIDNI